MNTSTLIRCLIQILIGFEACQTALQAKTFVVDRAASGSSDSNPGAEEKPFKTIQHAADVAGPGDTILVMAGRYDERVRIRTGGAEGQLISISAIPRRSVIVGGFDVGASYVRIQGFEITSDKPAVAVQLEGSHCQVLDNYIHEMKAGVSGTVGKLSADGKTRDYSAVAHNRIAYNRVFHSEYGFILGGNDWLVEDNEVERLFMYAPGNKYDDCDYSRFFGKGCVERRNYYHGSTAAEIRVAHVDCLQTFTVNGEIAQDLLFENNTCFDFHQMCMVEGAPHIGSVRNWTFRGNIVSANSPTMSGGWGPDIIQTPDVTIMNNTISTVRWAAIGLRGVESTNGRIFNNILCNAERAVIDGDRDFSAAAPLIDYNLTFAISPAPGTNNVNGRDPLFVDSTNRNFRLQRGSPAIKAGKDSLTIGALDYPNLYMVDPRHPAASDKLGWGYPAVPFATLAGGCAVAKPGETLVLRGGVYREVLRPQCNGLTVRVMDNENVILSGADLIENWSRSPDGSWSAPLASVPTKVLRDGQEWNASTYDPAEKQLIVKGLDPRLHVFEAVLRENAIDLNGKSDVKVQGLTITNLATHAKLK